MNARTVLNIGLAVAVSLAAAFYLRPAPPPDATFRVLDANPADLRTIEVSRAGDATIRLERDAQAWHMSAPLRARLDDVALGRILEFARQSATTRMPATDLARFGLDRPWARVRFDGDSIELGSSNEVTRELYVRRGEFVFPVPARLAAAIPATPAKLLAHRLFAAHESPSEFRFERFAVRYDGTRWQIDPADPNLSQDDLVHWTERWRLASSVVTQPHSGPRTGETVRVTLRDGRGIDLIVRARTPDLIVLRDDESLDYHLPPHYAELLLAPGATAK